MRAMPEERQAASLRATAEAPRADRPSYRRFAVGRLTNQTITAQSDPPMIIRAHHASTKNTSDVPPTTTMSVTAQIFAGSGMLPVSRHSRMSGPKSRLASSHR